MSHHRPIAQRPPALSRQDVRQFAVGCLNTQGESDLEHMVRGSLFIYTRSDPPEGYVDPDAFRGGIRVLGCREGG